ncbi:MAG: outer membrane protein assembly factor BamD [Nitrospirales bacterium]|nr:outer membrane protein assembly factor BamD [Nitrospirales bacterium]
MLAASFLLLLPACGGGKGVKKVEAYDPEKYLQKADTLVADKEYEQARKILLEVKNRDASKKYAPLAQLKIAESYIRDAETEPGIEEYRKFLDQYPSNQNASYAQYQIAMAYFSQIESSDRGMGAARKALQEFLRLKELFPRNPYREVVDLRIEKCRSIIADGEFMVGKYYYEKESYAAAVLRLESLLGQFPDYRRTDEALLLLGKSYRALKQSDKAKEAFGKLIERYPSGKLAAEARKGL